MAIERSCPDVGYIGSDVYDELAFAQIVRAGSTVYFAGMGPLRGGLEDMEVVGTDMHAQLEHCFVIFGRLLESVGATPANVVSETIYATDGAALSTCGDVLQNFYGKDRPAAVGVEVRALFHPDQLCEISAIAVVG